MGAEGRVTMEGMRSGTIRHIKRSKGHHTAGCGLTIFSENK